MASTTFVDNQTIIYAAWLNDVNNAVYNGVFQASTISPTTVNCSNITATNATFTTATIGNLVGSLGNGFTISTSASKLYFAYNGTNIASLDTSGNFRTLVSTINGTTP